MKREDWYYWRLPATGFCFLFFGVGGLVLGIVLPLMSLWPGSRLQRQRRAQRVLRGIWRFFVGMMRGLGCLTYEVDRMQRLQRPGQLVVANHPSLIDVVFLVSFIENSICIVKDSLRRNPFTFGPVRFTGLISNADSNQMVADCVQALAEGTTLIIFPEGTRSVPGQPLQFHRGAANIALRSGATITPVTIQCDPPMLLKNEQWYAIPPRRAHFSFRVGDDIQVWDIPGCEEPSPRAARALTRYLLDYFTRETAQ